MLREERLLTHKEILCQLASQPCKKGPGLEPVRPLLAD